MTHLVLDNNQVNDFVKKVPAIPEHVECITLNPQVYVEILLGPNRQPHLEALQKLPIRFGLDTQQAMERAARLGIGNLRSFTPWDHAADQRLRRGMAEPVRSDLAWARALKDDNKRFCRSMLDLSEKARSVLMGPDGRSVRKHSDPVATLRAMCRPDRIGWLVTAGISNGGRRVVAVKDEAILAREALSNDYLKRLFWMQVFYMLSVTGLWYEQLLNVKKHQDDWPDLTNCFYADDGDIVLTADRWLRSAIETVEKAAGFESPVRALTVEEFLGM